MVKNNTYEPTTSKTSAYTEEERQAFYKNEKVKETQLFDENCKEVSELLDVSKQTIHYHLKSLPSNLKVNKVGNKSLIDDNTIDYLKQF